MEIKLHKSGAMSVHIEGGCKMWLTPHSIARYCERESVDIEALCYRAVVSRRVPSREWKKYRRHNFARKVYAEGHELREHGDAMFIIDPKKPIVITVIRSSYIK